VKVRYQADENLDDWTVLGRCASEGRILVTYDVRTMPAHFAGFITQQPSSGVLLATRNLRLAEVIESLVFIWNCSEAEEWINRICFLPL
jgi:hypothetical protein